jgi:hypothetical protein
MQANDGVWEASMKWWIRSSICATAVCFIAGAAQGATNLGMVGVQNSKSKYLQAHYPDGELHSSNRHRNEEETWFLVEVDGPGHIYALYNWRNGQFISKKADGCAPANSAVLGDTEKWEMVSGKPYGVVNAVALRQVQDHTYLMGNDAGQNTHCGGEVASELTVAPPHNSDWPGWWVLTPATTPSPGSDFWNTVGGAVVGAINAIKPADVAAVITAIAPVVAP